MPCNDDFAHKFDLLQAGLSVISELEEQTGDDSSPQLEQARSHLAQAGQKIATPEFDRRFSKAMGLASSVAVSYGQDDLAEDALELGGDEV